MSTAVLSTSSPIMARVQSVTNAAWVTGLLLLPLSACKFLAVTTEQTKCAQGTKPCGLACVAAQSQCRDNRCWDTSGRQILCYPSFQVCGDTVCPLFAFCSSEQCLPNTCAYRHKAWCPEDSGDLTPIQCSKQSYNTKCYASTSGLFTCQLSSGLMVAKCGSRMAVAMAAMLQHSHKQPHMLYPWHVFTQTGTRSLNSQHDAGLDVSSRAINTASRSIRRALLQYGSTLAAIVTGISSISGALGLGARGIGMNSGIFDTSMLSELHEKGRYLDSLSSSSMGSNSYNTYDNGATPEAGSLNENAYVRDGTTGLDHYRDDYADGYVDQDLASGYPAQTSHQPSGYTSMSGYDSHNPSTGISSSIMGAQYAPGVQDSVARFTPAVGSSSTTAQPGTSSGAFVQAGSGGLVAGSYGGGYAGAYSPATGTYGLGSSYGYPASYQGKAAGKAVVFMPAWFDPSKPNITYACPDGMPIGMMISVGIPCGIPLVSLDASQLPVVDGLPAAVDLRKSGLVQLVNPYQADATGTPNTYVPSTGYTRRLRRWRDPAADV